MGHRGVGKGLVAGVLVVALVACGGSDDPSPLPAAPTEGDAAVTTGEAQTSSANQSICEWSTDAAPVAFVQVFVDQSSAVSQRETTQAVLGAAQDVEIAGGTDGYVVGGLVGVQVVAALG